MRVKELTAWHVRVPLKKPIQHASHTRTETDNVIVRCVLDDGTEGFGEGVPRDYVTGETVDSALDAAAARAIWRPSSKPAALSRRPWRMVERLVLAPIDGDDRGCRGNAARCALELALLDAYGQHFREPLSAATRLLLAPDLYEPHKHVRYSGAITSASTGFKVRLAALRMRVWWFPNVKVKVGIAGQDDVYRQVPIRKRLGCRKMDMRLDAK